MNIIEFIEAVHGLMRDLQETELHMAKCGNDSRLEMTHAIISMTMHAMYRCNSFRYLLAERSFDTHE